MHNKKIMTVVFSHALICDGNKLFKLNLRQSKRGNGVATSMYGNMTPFLRHFHVAFDVASCLLKLPNVNKTRKTLCRENLLIRHCFYHMTGGCNYVMQIINK